MTLLTTFAPLDASLALLEEVSHGIGPDQFGAPTPCARWTVSQVLEHAILDQLIWAATITAGPAPAGDAFAPTGELVGSVSDLVSSAVSQARHAWSTLPTGVGELVTPLPQGAMVPDVAARACAMDAAVHAWDLAVATGQPSPLSAGLAAELLPVARGFVGPLRSYGVFAEALPSQPDDDEASTLLRFVGRDPHWPA